MKRQILSVKWPHSSTRSLWGITIAYRPKTCSSNFSSNINIKLGAKWYQKNKSTSYLEYAHFITLKTVIQLEFAFEYPFCKLFSSFSKINMQKWLKCYSNQFKFLMHFMTLFFHFFSFLFLCAYYCSIISSSCHVMPCHATPCNVIQT